MADETATGQTLHELNNALTRILTTAELIASDAPADGQTARDARDIRTAALDARRLVQLLSSQVAADR